MWSLRAGSVRGSFPLGNAPKETRTGLHRDYNDFLGTCPVHCGENEALSTHFFLSCLKEQEIDRKNTGEESVNCCCSCFKANCHLLEIHFIAWFLIWENRGGFHRTIPGWKSFTHGMWTTYGLYLEDAHSIAFKLTWEGVWETWKFGNPKGWTCAIWKKSGNFKCFLFLKWSCF